MDGVKVKSVKINLKNNCKSAGKYLLTFLKWFALAAREPSAARSARCFI